MKGLLKVSQPYRLEETKAKSLTDILKISFLNKYSFKILFLHDGKKKKKKRGEG